jgi:hypothetical protein
MRTTIRDTMTRKAQISTSRRGERCYLPLGGHALIYSMDPGTELGSSLCRLWGSPARLGQLENAAGVCSVRNRRPNRSLENPYSEDWGDAACVWKECGVITASQMLKAWGRARLHLAARVGTRSRLLNRETMPDFCHRSSDPRASRGTISSRILGKWGCTSTAATVCARHITYRL